MNSLLLDTNTLIWWAEDNKQLGRHTKTDIGSTQNRVFVSELTLLECSIKIRRKKLRVDLDLIDAEIRAGTFIVCPYDVWSAKKFVNLPNLKWADPFDTALMAQAIARQLTLVTSDSNILNADIVDLLVLDARK